LLSVLPDNFHDFAGIKHSIISGDTSFMTAMVAFLEFYLLTLIAYGSGAPGGLFAPTLVLGSALGAMVGGLERMLLGTGSITTFAVIGMGAFFSGVARTPLTAIVITFEMSSDFALLSPLMLTCVISSALGDLLNKGGLYDQLMHWNGINLRGPSPEENLPVVRAEAVMQKTVQSLSSGSLVKDVLPILGSSTQRGFPVVEKDELVGVFTQTDMDKLKQTESADNATIGHLMTPHPVAVSPDDSLDDILFLFSRYKFTWLPVTVKDKLVGIILQTDVLKALLMDKAIEADCAGDEATSAATEATATEATPTGATATEAAPTGDVSPRTPKT
jgi:CIC family chloride channel protein